MLNLRRGALESQRTPRREDAEVSTKQRRRAQRLLASITVIPIKEAAAGKLVRMNLAAALAGWLALAA